MLQRGLAVLLSICMLVGGSGNTVYAMNPQADLQAVNDVQNGTDTGEVSENADGGQNDKTENGSVGESGISDDGAAGNDGTSESGTDIDDGTSGDGTAVDDGALEDGTAADDTVPADGTDVDDGKPGDGTAVEDSKPEDGTVVDDGAPADGTDVDDGTKGDDTPSISDNDVPAGENDGEEQMEVIDTETLSMNALSASNIKEEELTLTVDGPQTVTLAESEKQWLSFTAPGEGIFRFYSATEDTLYRSKNVFLFHEKTDNDYSYFDCDYASGQYGDFNSAYRMQAGETVYLLVGFGSSSESGTFTVHAGKVAASELTVKKDSEGNYTLQSETYRLNLVLTPSYSTVKTAVKLLQEGDSTLTGHDSYRVYYKYSYDNRWGNTENSSNTEYLYSDSDYKGESTISSIAAGGKFQITELQLRDTSNNILAALGADEEEISVNTKTTEKLGVLAEVTAEDAVIEVRAEMTSNQNGRVRYRKKDESNWTYYKNTIYYYNTNWVSLAADPDTDYVIELTGTDMESVYDTAEVRTKAFAAQDITTEVTDITSSGAKINVTIGSYTGNNRYIHARVSYTDTMGDVQTSEDYLDTSYTTSNKIFRLQLANLMAGTEYRDLEVELDDSDDYSMEYVAYRTKVSFTTATSMITAEQIAVTVTPDAEDGTKAVLKTALQGVSDGTYSYRVKYRVAGSKDWTESWETTGTLSAGNSYTDEQNLTGLMGNTKYDLQVMVDGIFKTASFTTAAAAVEANVEVKPLMQGIEVKAALTGASSGRYRISTCYYDSEQRRWMDSSYHDYNNCFLETDNAWKTTEVFYSSNIRPNAENDWKITIVNYDNYSEKIYEKYMTLEAVRQEITLSTEDIKCTSARIRGKLSTRDESIPYSYADSYYREKGTVQWIEGYSCSYGSTDGGTVYLSDLKEDTEYEFKLVPQNYPDDILAQTTFRTLKDTRNLSVSVDNCRYTTARVNWIFDSGANVLDSSSGIFIYYRRKGDSAWEFTGCEWRNTSYTGNGPLTGLNPGTTYEVLAELKDTDNSMAGVGVVRSATAEFTTAAVDHVLKAEFVAEGIKATSAAFIVQLTKATGTLENRAKAEVTLTPVNGGDAGSKEVFLNKDNGYGAKLVISGLVPETKYAVSAKLYESELNQWMALKEYDLGEITTAKADTPGTITLSEAEIAINKGTSKKLTVTAQPEEAAAGLIWSSSDTAVAAVDRDGTVTAKKAGETDITVSAAGSAADGQEKVSAVCHVTVRDYEIRVKNENGSYDSIPDILSREQKRILVVYDYTAGAELQGVTWTSSNPHTAKISEAGLLEPQNYGKAYITAQTTDGITLKRGPLNIVNEIQGFSITRPETDSEKYKAIRTAETVYQVAAGERYRVGCVLSPAYTDRYNSSVSMPGSSFNWKADNSAVTIKGYNTDLMEITIPGTVSGSVTITADMKDEEYRDKSFTITLEVLKKPEVETVPETYTFLNYSNRLKDVGLPENWQWKEEDTLIYESGVKIFTAYYAQGGYYPYETEVEVNARNAYGYVQAQGNYSSKSRAYIVKNGQSLNVVTSVSANSIPSSLYEQGPLQPAAKDAAKVNVTGNGMDGKYSVTASAKGTYTVSATTDFKKAAFTKQGGEYVLTAGEKVKDSSAGLSFKSVDTAPIQNITLAVADDSPEKVTISGEGSIEYEITAANADTKQKEHVIRLNVTAADTDGNPVENPQIDYQVSDTAVVKLKKEGNDKLVLTIPKGADGLAKIVATAKDDLGRSKQFAVRVKDYTPRVTTNKITINENYIYGKEMAQVLLPYENGDDRIEKVSLIETADSDRMVEVVGLEVFSEPIWDEHEEDRSEKFGIYLKVKDKEQIKNKGNLKYYLAIKTKAYGGTVIVPVQIKLETGMPTVTLKQSGKVNVFYTNTTHLTSYDAVSMGLVEVSSTASIDSVRWAAGDGAESGANTEFVIDRYSTYVLKNGKYTKKYMIQQHRPILDSSKKPSDAAAKGTLYIKLSGYKDEISKPFTIQTVYKKPTLKVADYKVCPALGEESDHQYIYTNASKTSNWMLIGSTSVWRGYSDVVCADEEVKVLNDTNVSLRYTGTKDKKTQLTLYSDYWYESLTVPVKVKVAKSKVKLSTATVTLNTAYPTEITQTAAAARICNAETGSYVAVSDVGIVGANAQAQQMLDQSLINMDYMSSRLSISVNYANAMGNKQFKPGSYKYKLTPYYGDTKLNDVTLTVKIIDKEAAVKVKTKGTIDLLKLDRYGTDYDEDYSSVVTVTPTFQNLDSSYRVENAELCGAYKSLFEIAYRYSNGVLEILPGTVGRLKAGKSYTLSVKYTVKDAYGEGGETITVTSNTFTIKPKQSVPKVTSSVKQLTLYASAKGEDKGETMNLYVPHDYKKGYYAIEYVYGSLDVNKDGRTDLIVTTAGTYKPSGQATIKVYVQDADAVKATAKGTAYKIPVRVQCVGRDGVSKDASTTVSVVVKK